MSFVQKSHSRNKTYCKTFFLPFFDYNSHFIYGFYYFHRSIS